MNKQINKIPIWILPILSILFYYISWNPISLWPFIFLFPLPMLLFLQKGYEKNIANWKMKISVISALLLVNTVLTLWVSNAHWSGTLAAGIVNTILMTTPFILANRYIRKGQFKFTSFIFILSFVSLEYLQNFWDLTWHWFNLGNTLSSAPGIIQWYQFTGVHGGSFWILSFSVLVYLYINKANLFKILISFLLINISVLFLNLNTTKPNNKNPLVKSIIYQPNLDAYHQKFDIPLSTQIKDFINYLPKDSSQEDIYVFLPETFLHRRINTKNIQDDKYVKYFQELLPHENIYILSGASMIKTNLNKSDLHHKGVRHNPYTKNNYISYNSALLFNKKTIFGHYHKSKLVAGVETTPFKSFLEILFTNVFQLDLGGVSGDLGVNSEAINLTNGKIHIAPTICFESTFSDYTTSFTNKKNDLISIITNDDWWGNTAGHKQHFEIAKIRAIENNKWVVRSANTGISGIINNKGEVIEKLDYKKGGIITQNVMLHSSPSFYAKNGNILARLCIFVCVLLILQLEVVILRKLY
jgi:apolipoprotein N-acyltransferase